MKAMLLQAIKQPLCLVDLPIPRPSKGKVLVKISACGICRTDLHVVDGELPHPKLPLIPGHQIVGTVLEFGEGVKEIAIGERVGIPWLGGTCGQCVYCLSDKENLCEKALYTGYQINGGFAEYCVANASFCLPIPKEYSDLQAAPLLCAGLIGYRSYRMLGEAQKIGFYGFGASAHILTQVARFQGRQIFAFTRKGDTKAQELALRLGAVWAGDVSQRPETILDGAIIFAPAGELVPLALSQIDKGGTVVCAGIHMSDIPSFPYQLLWGERILRSVANLTRKDGTDFLKLAPQVPVQTVVTEYPLEKANEALNDLREGRFAGAAVLRLSQR